MFKNDCVRVYILKERDVPEVKANFGKCLLTEIGWNEIGGYNDFEIYAKISCNRLIVSKLKFYDAAKIFLWHRDPCIAKETKHEDINKIVNTNDVKVRIAFIYETFDSKVILFRRTSKRLDYPNAWVLPKTILELNETLWECAIRVLKFDCGIKVSREHLEHLNLPTLFLWESFYPDTSSKGLPIRHYADLYMHVKLKKCITMHDLFSSFEPATDIYDSCACITVELAASILVLHNFPSLSTSIVQLSKQVTKVFSAMAPDENGKLKEQSLSTRTLTRNMQESEEGIEHVTYETKVAFNQWLMWKTHTSSVVNSTFYSNETIAPPSAFMYEYVSTPHRTRCKNNKKCICCNIDLVNIDSHHN